MVLIRSLVVFASLCTGCIKYADDVAILLPSHEQPGATPDPGALPVGKIRGVLDPGYDAGPTICGGAKDKIDAVKLKQLNEVLARAFDDNSSFSFSIGTAGATESTTKGPARMVATCEKNRKTLTIDGKTIDVDFIGGSINEQDPKFPVAVVWILSLKTGWAMHGELRTNGIVRSSTTVKTYDLHAYLPPKSADVFVTSSGELVVVASGTPKTGIYIGRQMLHDNADIARFTE